MANGGENELLGIAYFAAEIRQRAPQHLSGPLVAVSEEVGTAILCHYERRMWRAGQSTSLGRERSWGGLGFSVHTRFADLLIGVTGPDYILDISGVTRPVPASAGNLAGPIRETNGRALAGCIMALLQRL